MKCSKCLNHYHPALGERINKKIVLCWDCTTHNVQWIKNKYLGRGKDLTGMQSDLFDNAAVSSLGACKPLRQKVIRHKDTRHKVIRHKVIRHKVIRHLDI